RAMSPSVSPSPRSGSLNSYATSDSYRVVREDRVDTFDAVHDLRHTEVDDDARECVRVTALEAALALHQVEHAGDGQSGGLVEILRQAERDPRLRRPHHGPVQLDVGSHVELEHNPVHPTLERELRAH